MLIDSLFGWNGHKITRLQHVSKGDGRMEGQLHRDKQTSRSPFIPLVKTIDIVCQNIYVNCSNYSKMNYVFEQQVSNDRQHFNSKGNYATLDENTLRALRCFGSPFSATTKAVSKISITKKVEHFISIQPIVANQKLMES